MEFRDKCAVVTGGGHGIGRALAERLAAEGARVVVADIHPERTKKVADRIGGTPFVGNLGERAAVTALVEAAVSAYGPIDIFCSNAGIGDLGPDLASTKEQLDTIVQINLMAHIWAAQDVVPSMVERGGGHLVQTISSASLITGPSGLGYTVTKHGALGFAEWMALNYSHLGIKVTCLCPNAVNTGMLGRNEDAENNVGPPPAPAAAASLGDIVEPEECAEQTIRAMIDGHFLVLPHPRVGESFLRKATDYDVWLEGTNRRLRRMRGEEI